MVKNVIPLISENNSIFQVFYRRNIKRIQWFNEYQHIVWIHQILWSKHSIQGREEQTIRSHDQTEESCVDWSIQWERNGEIIQRRDLEEINKKKSIVHLRRRDEEIAMVYSKILEDETLLSEQGKEYKEKIEEEHWCQMYFSQMDIPQSSSEMISCDQPIQLIQFNQMYPGNQFNQSYCQQGQNYLIYQIVQNQGIQGNGQMFMFWRNWISMNE